MDADGEEQGEVDPADAGAAMDGSCHERFNFCLSDAGSADAAGHFSAGLFDAVSADTAFASATCLRFGCPDAGAGELPRVFTAGCGVGNGFCHASFCVLDAADAARDVGR